MRITGIHWNSPEIIGIHRNLPEFTGIHRNSPEFTEIYEFLFVRKNSLWKNYVDLDYHGAGVANLTEVTMKAAMLSSYSSMS